MVITSSVVLFPEAQILALTAISANIVLIKLGADRAQEGMASRLTLSFLWSLVGHVVLQLGLWCIYQKKKRQAKNGNGDELTVCYSKSSNVLVLTPPNEGLEKLNDAS